MSELGYHPSKLGLGAGFLILIRLKQYRVYGHSICAETLEGICPKGSWDLVEW
jgi:hypothetical protein